MNCTRTSVVDKIGRLEATLVTVLLSVGYCTVSSVAAPPRHPAPLFQILVMFRVGARECGFAIRLVHVLSSRIASGV